MNEWIWLFVGLAVSSGVFALLVVLYPKLKGETQGYPMEAIVEPLLLPIIYEAICAAYRISEQAMDEIGERVRGLDKKVIADTVYAMLPDEIAGYDTVMPEYSVDQEVAALGSEVDWGDQNRMPDTKSFLYEDFSDITTRPIRRG